MFMRGMRWCFVILCWGSVGNLLRRICSLVLLCIGILFRPLEACLIVCLIRVMWRVSRSCINLLLRWSSCRGRNRERRGKTDWLCNLKLLLFNFKLFFSDIRNWVRLLQYCVSRIWILTGLYWTLYWDWGRADSFKRGSNVYSLPLSSSKTTNSMLTTSSIR